MSEQLAKGASAKAAAIPGDHHHDLYLKKTPSKGTTKGLDGATGFTKPGTAFPAAPAAAASADGSHFKFNHDRISQALWDRRLAEDLFRGSEFTRVGVESVCGKRGSAYEEYLLADVRENEMLCNICKNVRLYFPDYFTMKPQ